MSEPTGLEHVTPVEITATSATERAAFRKCRRSWFLQTVHHLETAEGNTNFWLGEIVHSGLESFYKGQQAGMPLDERSDMALAAYEDAYDAAAGKVEEELGFLWPIASPMYADLGEMGFLMLQGYFEREAIHPIGDEIVQVEQRLFVPILGPDGREVGRLAVRTDMFVRRYGNLTAVDHKTAGHKLGSAALDIDDQLTAEVYAGWKVLGEFPENALYNALLKKRPVPPKRNLDKKGVPQLSKAKNQATTARLYREEIAKLEIDEADYADILEFLEEQEAGDETPFYYREETFRTPGQMASFERNLYHEFMDMKAVAANPELAYPNPGFACQSCPVQRVCVAMMDDSDAGFLIQNNFAVGRPRY